MLYCRFQHEGVISHGVVGGDRVTPIAGDLFGAHKSGRRRLPLSEVRLLAPIVPRKILAAAVNYQSHIPSGSTVIFKVTNQGKISHDFKIAGKKTPLVQPGQSATLTVKIAKPGRYPYLCTVPGHAAAGMKGTFTVK